MSSSRELTYLCIASFFKGGRFIKASKKLGIKTILITLDELKDKDWPWESIDEVFYMPEAFKLPDIVHAVSYLCRERKIDCIVPLDDFDVETAAALREHLRCPGMGDTTARYFRDKLAMRVQARDHKIKIPRFVGILNYDEIRDFIKEVPAPWILKPRSEAGAVGIKKVHTPEELWETIEFLGDKQSYYLLEEFITGDVLHVDSVVNDSKVLFARGHRYGTPPFKVWNEGGVFTSVTMPASSKDHKKILKMHQDIVKAMGLVRGVTHAEFIQDEKGDFYFLELAARVGGAHIEEVLLHGSGIDLWGEWAKLERAYLLGEKYSFKAPKAKNSGLLVCLTKQESPTPDFKEVKPSFWEGRENHIAIVVSDNKHTEVVKQVESLKASLEQDFLAVAPPTDKAVH